MSERVSRLPPFYHRPVPLKAHYTHVLTRVFAQVTHINCVCVSTRKYAQTHGCHTLFPHCPLIVFVPYLSLTRLNPLCGLIKAFSPNQILVFWSVTVVAVLLPAIKNCDASLPYSVS
ncbi:hypothetical protein ACTXT7_002445 [Hymenolepis weldensis]